MFKKNGIHMLEISINSTGEVNVIHPAIIWDEDDLILIDTGYPGNLNDLRVGIEKAGVLFERLTKILITHQDIDHIGSLPNILEESPEKIDVYASELEKPFIQGEKMILRITPESITKALESLPPEVPEDFRRAFKSRLENPPKAKVDHVIEGGQELPYCGGVIAIDTAGHTPGHLSFYHQASKTLIAGDALIVQEGQLYPADPKYALDNEMAIKSLDNLLSYDIEKVICYHGGLFAGNFRERLLEILKG
ncbi:MBL fold metallo-hydrolase [Bacillus salipaludis]|uniref:MBL fold metallo-hydrolase n=1 Tax=Bacillus salipaludis TaxID=2547811 RepID=A0A4R5VX96_9BACI|nr:MBL fold metallo-hydrolase [Bacillus salipaludis]MDQ6597572.1 MBL fold metallo-hydrolase [Bacillus salipaludis]TDK63011.1 MBL fold metallo-hydrolase [Bacillus salipaludis]